MIIAAYLSAIAAVSFLLFGWDLVVEPLGRSQAYCSRRFNAGGSVMWLVPWLPLRMLYVPVAHIWIRWARLNEVGVPRTPEGAAPMNDGLYRKYKVYRGDEQVKACFVLRYDRDPHALVALRAYADSIQDENPELADDLRSLKGV